MTGSGLNITAQAGYDPGLPPLRLTLARWKNERRPGGRYAKVLAHKGSYEQFAYDTETPSDWHGYLQRAIICSPKSGVIAVDVDYPDDFARTRTARIIGREQALTVRGERFHVLVDCRAVRPEDWPRQGPIAGADIKSNGFIPFPGCEHWSGQRYEPVLHERLYTVVDATRELIAAINADRADRDAKPRGQGESHGGNGGGHDGELAAEVLRMVLRGLTQEQCYAEWQKIAAPRDPSWPFDRADFERHYRGAAAKAAQIRAAEAPLTPDALAWAQSTAAPSTPWQANPSASAQAVAPPPEATQGPPRIDCGQGGGPATIRAVQDALNSGKIPQAYVTDGRAVVLEAVSGSQEADDSRPLPATASQADAPLLASLLARHTRTVRTVKGSEVEFTPEARFLAATLAPKSWPGLPPLHGIIGAPVLRPDGSLLQQPGYDRPTGLYLASRIEPPMVPDRPTGKAVAWAKDLLLSQVLADFPWRGPADRANYLAMLVTQFLRRYLHGSPVPFFAVTAPKQGSGKTLLVTIPGVLFGLAKLVWPGEDDELRKVLTTVMTSQEGVIAFDNIPAGTVLRSATLSKLLTDRTWGDRLLGGNVLAKFTNDRLWAGDGNNLRIGGDMGSRSVLVSLMPETDHPERRSGFRIPDLEGWIEEPQNQQHLLAALLVLVADWAAAGCPDADVMPMRQFTKWARVCGGFLAHHGIVGFLANAAEAEDADDDAADWAGFLAAWHRRFGDSWVMAEQACATGRDPAWAGTFPLGRDGGDISSKGLGRRLSGQRDAYHGAFVLRGQRDPHTKTWWWRVESWRA